MMFKSQSSKPNLRDIQQSISAFWKDNHIFEKSIEQRSEDNPYRFYDGPPFVTGLPHYGHLASSVAKDVIPRYQAMRGKRVDRVWGWDCHGIPIEQKVQAKLGLTSNREIEENGVEQFIEGCYDFTRSTSDEWKWYVDNFGRWVDFDGSYKTMDNDYMESVWRVFKEIWDKGLIYKGKRVSLYSTKLETPISNFEVAMDDSYDEINDPAITVRFALKEQEGLGKIMNSNGVQKVYLISGKHACASTSGYFAELESELTNAGYDVLIIDHVDSSNPYLEKNLTHFSQFDFDQSIVITHSLGASTFLSYLDGTDGVSIKHLMMIAPAYGDIHSTNPDWLKHSGYVGWSDDLSFDHLANKISYSSVVKSDDDILSQESFSALADLLGSTLIHEEGKKHFFSKEYTHVPDVVRDYFLPDVVSLLARTTTPWTIPANLALGVHKDLEYVVVNHDGDGYIVAKARVEDVFKGKEHEIVSELKGSDLVGLSYEPPYDYYTGRESRQHEILHAEFATDESGTGIVHQAPEFGEDDFNLCQSEGIAITEAMNARGEYTDEIVDYVGMFYRDANDAIMDRLKESGHLFAKASITHRVAFCPRTHVPLVYKAQDSWFIDIQNIKDRLLAANEQINWYPGHFKHGRFAKSIETAPDRCISRSRYWGTPMPVYVPETALAEGAIDTDKAIVLGSIEELYERQKEGSDVMEKREEGGKVIYRNTVRDKQFDLHKPYVDDVRFEVDGEKYVRIPEVLDCWMESGAMPYGQMHYPFENREKMEASFPADYIVEYTGQIRAWFYVMHVLGVILFDKPAYKNVICHGVVSGNDGRKMSKSLENFPDPKPTFQQYGGDAIRMSILTSPLFNAGDTAITEEGIADALRGYVLPLWNAFSFFTTYANIDQRSPSDKLEAGSSQNVLDQWILGEFAHLTQSISTDLDKYDLQHSSRALGEFLDNLTNRYIRRSRRRFWKTESSDDKQSAYQTLYEVLLGFCQVAAPFMPFVTEYVYRELKAESLKLEAMDSVHLTDWPEAGERDEELAASMARTQYIVTMGLAWRSQHNIRVRQPLSTLTVGVEMSDYYRDIIREELNIKSVICDLSLNDEVTKIVKPDGKKIGPKFGKDVKVIFGEAKSGNFVEQDDGSVLVADQWVLEAGEYEISYIKKDPTKDVVVDRGIVMSIDATITPELELEGYVRDLVRAIQDARKEADYEIADRIRLAISDKLEAGSLAIQMKEQFGEYIQQETLSTIVDDVDGADLEKEIGLGGEVIYFALKR